MPHKPPGVATALRTLLALASSTALVLAACGDDAPAEPALSTVTAGGASQPALDGTAAVDGTASEGTVEPTASTGAIAVEELGVAQFTRADGSTVDLPLEVPPTEEYPIGLSGRSELEGRGMLFDYSGEEARDRPFWMKNTHVDLDIAFIAPDGRVGAIKQMTAESEEYVYSGIAYDRAIEAPVGWYEANGVAVGDAVELLLD